MVEIRAIIAHPMFRGHSGSSSGPRPRRIIHTFKVHYANREIFHVELFPGVSANPVFTIKTRATETAELKFVWTEDGGAKAEETRTLNVVAD